MIEAAKLSNLFKQNAIAILSTFTQPRIATIAGYDPNTYTAKVMIQPDGIITNYLPILSTGVGNGYGIYTAPANGDMVLVLFQEGDLSTGIIVGAIFNSVDIPINPGPPSGETWMVKKTGSYLKLKSDGTVEIKTLDANGNPTNVNIISNVVVTGNLTVTGDVLDNSGTNTNTVKAMRTIYDSHTHGGVAIGGSNSAAPNQPM